jgi:tRNA-splicing ligase RtcB
MGTLGSGNHFIEICLDEDENVWVMLHSGSRGIGNKIGQYFIEKAKKDMERWFIHLPDSDLAYIPTGSDLFADYWFALNWAQKFASYNREVMMHNVLNAIQLELKLDDLTIVGMGVNCHHNYATYEKHFGKSVILTRKGAVKITPETYGIIPGSMGAKSYIVRGIEGEALRDSYNSCSHGAGRAMSRRQAHATFTLEQHAAAVKGVECRVDEAVIDETPAAYKDIDAVMAAQADHVEIVTTLKQVLCVKG